MPRCACDRTGCANLRAIGPSIGFWEGAAMQFVSTFLYFLPFSTSLKTTVAHGLLPSLSLRSNLREVLACVGVRAVERCGHFFSSIGRDVGTRRCSNATPLSSASTWFDNHFGLIKCFRRLNHFECDPFSTPIRIHLPPIQSNDSHRAPLLFYICTSHWILRFCVCAAI